MIKKTILCLSVALVCGCQSYQRLDLSLESDLQRWRELGVGVGSKEQKLTPDDTDALTNNLSLAKAREFTLRFNPSFVAAVNELITAQSVADNSGYWRDPSIGFDASRMLSDTEKRWTTGGAIGLAIPINGALALEKKLAEKEKFAQAAILREKRVELLRELNDSWLEWSALEKKIALYSEYITTLTQISNQSSKLGDAGELESTEVRLLTMELEETRSNLEMMCKDQQRLRLNILAIAGIHPDAPCRLLPQDKVDQPVPQTVDSLIQQENPQLQRLRAVVESADNRYRLELRRQYPDLELSIGYEDDLDARSVPLGVSLTLPLWNRNRLGVSKASAERDTAAAQLKAQAATLLSETSSLKLKHSQSSVYSKTLKTRLIPLADRQISEVIARLKAGEADTLLIYQVMHKSLTIREKVIDAELATVKTINQISALYGYEKGD